MFCEQRGLCIRMMNMDVQGVIYLYRQCPKIFCSIWMLCIMCR